MYILLCNSQGVFLEQQNLKLRKSGRIYIKEAIPLHVCDRNAEYNFEKVTTHIQKVPGLSNSTQFSFPSLRNEVPAQLLHFRLYRSQFKEKLNYCPNTIELGP